MEVSLHVNLGNTKIHVELAHVEGAVETTSAFASQEIKSPPLVLGQIDYFHGLLFEEGWNFLPQVPVIWIAIWAIRSWQVKEPNAGPSWKAGNTSNPVWLPRRQTGPRLSAAKQPAGKTTARYHWGRSLSEQYPLSDPTLGPASRDRLSDPDSLQGLSSTPYPPEWVG